jgi:hypothetical protein
MTNARYVFSGIAALAAVLFVRVALAEPKGQLYITKDRLPEGGEVGRASTARGREVRQVWPAEERGNDVTTWRVNYAAFLPRPLGDYQAELKFWDVTKGPARFVRAEDQFTRHKDTRVMIGQVTVDSPDFERNHRYLVRLESRHNVFAEITFWLRGTPPRYDGRADFTDEETKK